MIKHFTPQYRISFGLLIFCLFIGICVSATTQRTNKKANNCTIRNTNKPVEPSYQRPEPQTTVIKNYTYEKNNFTNFTETTTVGPAETLIPIGFYSLSTKDLANCPPGETPGADGICRESAEQFLWSRYACQDYINKPFLIILSLIDSTVPRGRLKRRFYPLKDTNCPGEPVQDENHLACEGYAYSNRSNTISMMSRKRWCSSCLLKV